MRSTFLYTTVVAILLPAAAAAQATSTSRAHRALPSFGAAAAVAPATVPRGTAPTTASADQHRLTGRLCQFGMVCRVMPGLG